jgi:hypothetical protein
MQNFSLIFWSNSKKPTKLFMYLQEGYESFSFIYKKIMKLYS